jgi:hypothetical protein
MSTYLLKRFFYSGAPLPKSRSFPKDSQPIVTEAPATHTLIESSLSERERVRATLVTAGLSLPATNVPVAGKLSPEQREELAQRVSVGTPLSEIIIEERRSR